MIVALSVLAFLMLIGGLAAMVQGIPFIRLEVGWTMVIAGTVGASAGAVLLGITAAVARLGRIERALAGRPVGERPVSETPFPARPHPDRPLPALAVPEPAAPETGAAPMRALRNEPVLPPIPFPATTPAAQEPRRAEPAGFDGGAALAAGAAGMAVGLAASELRLTRAEDADPPAGPHEPRLDQHKLDAPRLDEAKPYEPVPHEPVMPDPAYRDPVHHEPPPPPPPVEEARVGDGAKYEEPVSPPALPAVEPPPPPAPEPAPPLPQEELLPEEPPGKTVIGTYDSGGNTYTMYADGTIDAETPAGRFHFASIDELKAFRNAGGEGAARSA